MENIILHIIESGQKICRYASIPDTFLSSYNFNLKKVKKDLINSSISFETKQKLKKLQVLDPNEIDAKLAGISFWERPHINKWAGSYGGWIFSNNHLSRRKYLMLNHFQLELILAEIKSTKT